MGWTEATPWLSPLPDYIAPEGQLGDDLRHSIELYSKHNMSSRGHHHDYGWCASNDFSSRCRRGGPSLELSWRLRQPGPLQPLVAASHWAAQSASCPSARGCASKMPPTLQCPLCAVITLDVGGCSQAWMCNCSAMKEPCQSKGCWSLASVALAPQSGSINDEAALRAALLLARCIGLLPCSAACRCIGQSLAHVMHDATVARLFSHFSFCLAARMGGPAGVDAKAVPSSPFYEHQWWGCPRHIRYYGVGVVNQETHHLTRDSVLRPTPSTCTCNCCLHALGV